MRSIRRLGLTVPASGSMAGLPALARLAEDSGFTDAWSYEVNLYDPFTPLAAAAATTVSMRLGTAIVPVFTRPPGVIAVSAAALADLGPGRFVLGLGASTKVLVEQWYGVPFERPLERTREVLLEVRRLLAGEKVGELRLGRPPAQPPPIWLAALGPRMLELARELADGVCFYMVGPRGLPALIEAAGGKESVCRINVFPGTGGEVDEFARRQVVAYAIVPYYARAMERQGFGEEVAAIGRLWSQGERRSAPGQVSQAMLDELTLRGSPEQVLEGLERYYEAGLRVPALNFWLEGDQLDRFLAELGKIARLQ